MTRKQLKLTHIQVTDFTGQKRKIMSYIEAAELVVQTTSSAVTYHFVDEAGEEVCLTFTGTDYSNAPCYLSGYDTISSTEAATIPPEPPEREMKGIK